MVGLARKGEKELDCPFCGKGKIKTFYKEGYKQANTSRISGRKATRSYQRPETYEVLENCPVCGKTKNEIQKAINTGKTKVLSHEERIAMLKKRGLPLVIGGKQLNQRLVTAAQELKTTQGILLGAGALVLLMLLDKY